MRKIFISYRRVEAEVAAGALGRDLRRLFGDEQVFRDKEDIGGGVSWKNEVLHEISKDSALLVLIGKGWADATDARGRRLDNSDDPLRLEITAALNEEAFIIPILLENAEMPSEEDLPPELQPLAGINALKLRDDDWPNDLDRIRKTLENAGFKTASSLAPEAKETENGHSSNKVPPSRASAHPCLNEILPGVWQVQIQAPFPAGVMGQLNVEMFPTGMFRGQLANPMGVTAVQGGWQVNLVVNQIALQGTQTNGFQTAPYFALVQVSSFESRQILGMTSAGEQVNWQRVSSPPVPPPVRAYQ